MEKLTAVMYNDCEKVCLFVLLLYLPTNICKTELFNPRNPYDTDLPVISDAWELSYFSFFVLFSFGARRVVFFCWLLLLLEFLFEMSRRLHIYMLFM